MALVTMSLANFGCDLICSEESECNGRLSAGFEFEVTSEQARDVRLRVCRNEHCDETSFDLLETDSILLENTLTAAVFRQDRTLSTGALIFSTSLMMPPGGEAGAFEQGDRLVVTLSAASEAIFQASEDVSYDETDACRETCLEATVTLGPE
ncbi:MAG: hypothetical protein AAFN41_12730 [Planctomycetota bacterium]